MTPPPEKPFHLSWTLAAKVGLLVAHVEEGLSRKGHAFDAIAVKTLIEDADVQEWLKELRSLSLLPVKR